MTASAVRAGSGVVLVDVVVSPGARTSEVQGADPWRRAVQVRVAAPSRGGQANAELLRFLAARLRVPAASVALVSGARSRRKTIAVSGLDEEDVRARLRVEAR